MALSAVAATLVRAELTEREQSASEVAGAFLKELGKAMTREMSKGGPREAIKVCAELAPEIAGRLSREHGRRVTRVGTRVRNPLLGMPDAWEQKVLAEFAERAAKGEAFTDMSRSEVVTEPAGQYFRFMKPNEAGGKSDPGGESPDVLAEPDRQRCSGEGRETGEQGKRQDRRRGSEWHA